MLEFQGKYASCLVMSDELDEVSAAQIRTFLDCLAFEGSRIRIMPDVHAGAGAVIGFTATLTDKVIPNVIGVDIGCGVSAHLIGPRKIDYEALDKHICEHVPSGFSVREKQSCSGAKSSYMRDLGTMR